MQMVDQAPLHMTEQIGCNMRKLLTLFLCLFAFCAHAETPLIQCNGTNKVLQSSSSPPMWNCVTTTPGGVTSFTGDGTLISNSASTGAVTATLANAGAYSVWGNNTGSSAAPGYQNSINISGALGAALSQTQGGIQLHANTYAPFYNSQITVNGGSGINSDAASLDVNSGLINIAGSFLGEVDVGNGGFTDPSPGLGYDIKTGGTAGGISSIGSFNTDGGYNINNSTVIDNSRNATPAAVVAGSPTGGNEGTGTINGTAVYQNGVQDFNTPGTGLTASGPTISCATASSSTVGCVKVDNTTITASSGTISAVNTGTVTTTGSPASGNLAVFSSASSITNGNAPLVLATVNSINAKAIANTALYTVPTGKTAVVTGVIVRCTAASSISSGPSAGIGNVAGTNNIFASATMNALTTTSSDFGFIFSGASLTTPAAGVIYLNIGTGASGTSQTISADILGYIF